MGQRYARSKFSEFAKRFVRVRNIRSERARFNSGGAPSEIAEQRRSIEWTALEGTGKAVTMLRPSLLRRGRKRGLLGIIPLLIGLAFVASGCDKLTGGGWIPSVVPGQKAYFSFVAHCQNTTIDGVPAAEFYDGQFEYSDQAFNPLLRIHGDVQPLSGLFGTVPGMTCAQFKKTDIEQVFTDGFLGTYRTQGTTGPISEGDFAVGVTDGGQPNSIDGDTLCVQLVGAFEYLHCGEVQGGNIQID